MYKNFLLIIWIDSIKKPGFKDSRYFLEHPALTERYRESNLQPYFINNSFLAVEKSFTFIL